MVESKESYKASGLKLHPNVSLTTSQLEAYLEELEKQKQALQEDSDN